MKPVRMMEFEATRVRRALATTERFESIVFKVRDALKREWRFTEAHKLSGALELVDDVVKDLEAALKGPGGSR